VSSYRFLVNGAPAEVDVPGMRRLLDVRARTSGSPARRRAARRGVRACSVILDGQVVDACLVPICQVEGRIVRTVEGLSLAARSAARSTPCRRRSSSMAPRNAASAPGMLMAARAYLDGGGDADEDRIREAIAGNLCRCTGYTKIATRSPAVAHVA